ncbi:chromatin remodeling complex protein [Coniophora puteana RWD-64-598 SS2]|uniref:Chromatin remodeling complex protein n=1 Tax=Coniophora puteana (strain RWD-64-598) TaxID=741705 RepID=A0A5M3N567_CONPW|nr:chromatin remodeling complex protein [Coniophora puteana RWD-64-598 SS2]EIW86562.1 chromatin remodeling complex protein [Coniophora puteana RWD-64-598 SS2]
MPICRRKRVVLTVPSHTLVAGKTNLAKEVFYLHQTGEVFETYEQYAARMSFYRLKQFQCEVTGKSGLDYFQAVESEQQEARTMHSRFPEPLKPAVLKAVQWQVVGRLDHLVEAVYDRFKDRYFAEEKVFVDVQGDKFYAKVVQVFPPKSAIEALIGPVENHASPSNSPQPYQASDKGHLVHKIGGDLAVPAKEAIARDDPAKYFYKVQILEEQTEKNHEKGRSLKEKAKWSGSLMDVQCTALSRDRLAFSKSILRRFIRDCVDRDAAVASPWTVKPVIANHYGVDTQMPEETRKGVENIKKGEIDKRKKIWEDKEGPPTKKQKKLTAAQEERVKALAVAAEKREREAQEKADKQQKVKEEAERLAAEKKKKKPIRYPTEDLDVRITDKEKKAGMKVKRPVPSKLALPFAESQATFESFLMTWNFLVVYGHPLHISNLTMDEFEHAIRHSVAEPQCSILAEIHSTLVYNLRTVPFNRHSALLSLMRERDAQCQQHGHEETVFNVATTTLTSALAEFGNNWERVPLRHTEERDGWQDALLGCLKDHATVENFPRLREVLTRFLFAPDSSGEPSASSASSRVSSPTGLSLTVPSTPAERYHTLPPADKIAILSFLCNIAVSSKAIHGHMEQCEEQLTALRKEKIEVNRQKKQYLEEMNALAGEAEVKEEPVSNGVDEDTQMPDSSDLSDIPSDDGSESVSVGSRPKSSSKTKDLRAKAHTQAHAKQRELARAKTASAKQAQAERRKLDEEVNKIERRLESIEREFRKLLGAIRVKPLGKDRFHNRIWWFDGMGGASLLGSGGVVQYGAGRIFIQGASEIDRDLLLRRDEDDVPARRMEEEGEEGMLGVGEWAVYTDVEEVDELVAWLNPKGVRELALKNAISKWWNHIAPGMRKRTADLNMSAKLPEARRSSRTKSTAGHDLSREPYMMWTNRRAVNLT